MSEAPTDRDRYLADQGLHRAVHHGDCLAPIQRDILGHSARRLHIPLRDPVDLRRVAAILRDLANKLEVSSHIRGDALTALFAAGLHIKKASGQLMSKPRRK